MRLRSSVVALLMAGWILLAGAASALTPVSLPTDLHDVDAYVEGVRKQFDIPGIAIAIVKDGKLVLARGYGERELGSGKPVDAQTLFAIASNTKAFTSAALSMLADEGKLKLEDRVIDHLPWFQMSDPVVTREMTLRDLLSHRSGLALGAGDLLFWPESRYSTDEIVRRLRHVPLATSFRANYAYDNILYAVAQRVIEQVSGQSYGDFLKTRIFDRLGMARVYLNHLAIPASEANVATGYAKADGKTLIPAPATAWANNSAAGGLYASVDDLAKWMIVQLNGGVTGTDTDGKEQRLFSAARQQAMWSVVTPIHVRPAMLPEFAPVTPQFAGYGEGWSLSDYRGKKLVWHTGGWPGMVSRITLLPELKLGIAVLTSQELGAAFNAPTYRILDAYLGAGKTDWTAAYAKAVAQSHADADKHWQTLQAARAKHSRPALPLSAYAGTYRDPWYGDVELRLDGKRLVMQFSKTAQLLGDLEHWQHDSFIVRWRDRSLNADAFASFALTPEGKIRELRMQAVSPLTDFSFDFHDLRLAPVATGDAP